MRPSAPSQKTRPKSARCSIPLRCGRRGRRQRSLWRRGNTSRTSHCRRRRTGRSNTRTSSPPYARRRQARRRRPWTTQTTWSALTAYASSPRWWQTDTSPSAPI